MRHLAFFILLALCIFGCGLQPKGYWYVSNSPVIANRTVPVWIDGSFDVADKLIIESAIKQWNYVLNRQITISVVDDNFNMSASAITDWDREHGWLVLKIDKESDIIPDNGGGRITLAFTNAIGGNLLYIVREVIRDEAMYGVSLHEIGHLLGAEHTSSGLMSPMYNKYSFECIDKGTANEVAEYQHLYADNMNFCYHNY